MPSGVYNHKSCSEKTKQKMREAKKGKTHSGNFKKGNIPWNKGKEWIGNTGEEHHSWKGGKILRKDGYIMLYNPEHPFATHGRYVFEHRLVMEKKLGRFLTPEEIVHHIDGDKVNNIEENLKLFPNQREHMNYHGGGISEN